MEHLVIFGATELAEMSHFYLTHDSPYEVSAFTVDRDYIKEETLNGLPVVPFEEIESTYPPGDYKMLVAIWYGRVNKTRAEKYYQVKAKGYELISYISSKAITWPGLVVGDNCLVFENTVCHLFAQIGNNVIIRSSCEIGHHSIIKDHCYVAPRAVVLGGVTVEPYCFIGANSTIRNDITIASECVVGAGALVLEDTEEKCVYKGNPAVLLPKKSDELKRI
jgi:sugar O-acyltransferase (sialic acid O-acetyltransferase NeuD family)